MSHDLIKELKDFVDESQQDWDELDKQDLADNPEVDKYHTRNEGATYAVLKWYDEEDYEKHGPGTGRWQSGIPHVIDVLGVGLSYKEAMEMAEDESGLGEREHYIVANDQPLEMMLAKDDPAIDPYVDSFDVKLTNPNGEYVPNSFTFAGGEALRKAFGKPTRTEWYHEQQNKAAQETPAGFDTDDDDFSNDPYGMKYEMDESSPDPVADDMIRFSIDDEDAYEAVMNKLGDRIDFDGDYMVADEMTFNRADEICYAHGCAAEEKMEEGAETEYRVTYTKIGSEPGTHEADVYVTASSEEEAKAKGAERLGNKPGFEFLYVGPRSNDAMEEGEEDRIMELAGISECKRGDEVKHPVTGKMVTLTKRNDRNGQERWETSNGGFVYASDLNESASTGATMSSGVASVTGNMGGPIKRMDGYGEKAQVKRKKSK